MIMRTGEPSSWHFVLAAARVLVVISMILLVGSMTLRYLNAPGGSDSLAVLAYVALASAIAAAGVYRYVQARRALRVVGPYH